MREANVMLSVRPDTRDALRELVESRRQTYDQIINEFLVLFGVPSSDKPSEFTEIKIGGWEGK